MLRNFLFPGVVEFILADAENFLNGAVEGGAVGASELLPNVRNGFVAVMLDDVEN